MSVIYDKILTHRCVSNEECITLLEEYGIIKPVHVCICGVVMKKIHHKGKCDGYILRCQFCNKTSSICKRSVLEGSKLSICQILAVVVHFCEEECVNELAQKIGISRPSICRWYAILRKICGKALEANFKRLGGIGHTVQIDETVIARRKYNVGRNVQQQWLFGAIDMINGSFILRNIDNRSRKELQSVIIDTIYEDTHVISDCWSSYMAIFSNRNDYTHSHVNHSRNFVNPETGANTQLIENLWSRLKSTLRRKFQRSRGHLQEYLDEFCFRAKVKKDGRLVLFTSLLKGLADYV